MATTIAQIAKRAQGIRKAKPSIKWQSALKQASQELKGKGTKKTAPKRKTAKRRKVGSSNRQTGASVLRVDKKRKAKAPGKRVSATGRTYTERRRNRSDKPGSVAGMVGAVKAFYKEQLAKALLAKDLATTRKQHLAATARVKTYRSKLKTV